MPPMVKMLYRLFVIRRDPSGIREPRFRRPVIERYRSIRDRCRTAELSLDDRDITILETAEPRDAAALVKDHEKQFSVSRIDLAGECTCSTVRLSERSRLTDDAAGSEIRVEAILKRTAIQTGDRHDVRERHSIPGKIRAKQTKELHHRTRRNAVDAETARRCE